MSHVQGALIETFIVALKSTHRPAPAPDERVLILGAGPIGLCVQLLLLAQGVKDIIVSEPSPMRRDLAAELGSRATVRAVDPGAEDLTQVVMEATDGQGVDVTFECAGTQETLDSCFALTRRAGRISLIGHYRETPRLNVEPLVIRSMSVYGPAGGHGFYEEALELVRSGAVDLEAMVTHTYPLEQAVEAFEAACDVDRSVKVLFAP
jgi:threonine dehydrogenase-like Zn-dependent dehydrogenase